MFEEMQGQGCTPDVVTYTALISAYEKGGQWCAVVIFPFFWVWSGPFCLAWCSLSITLCAYPGMYCLSLQKIVLVLETIC